MFWILGSNMLEHIGTIWYMPRTFLLLKIFSGLESEFCRCLPSFGTTEGIKKGNQEALLRLCDLNRSLNSTDSEFWDFFQQTIAQLL